jgi:UDP-2,3-diacylglucosamine pyrophosphatase LpxH
VHAIRRLFGRPHWSLSAWAKTRTKKMVDFLSDFENLITRYAAERRCDGVIAGHTHTPTVKVVNGTLYCNCGDFQEQATAIVEHFDGRLELVDLRTGNLLPAEEVTTSECRSLIPTTTFVEP